MKKRLNLTIDKSIHDEIGELPRKVSISEMVSWILKCLVEGVKLDGMTSKEFINYMDKDVRGRIVRQYLKEKIGPILGLKTSRKRLNKK